MDEPQPGPSQVHQQPIPVIQQEEFHSDDSGSIPYADSPESGDGGQRKASSASHQLHDGIILLITSDSESQRSPIAQHPLSEFYLLPLPQDALAANRRYSLQDRNGKKHHQERKVSCPNAKDLAQLSPQSAGGHSRRSSSCSHRSDAVLLDGARDHLTPTAHGSRRPSSAGGCHSRRASNCSLAHHHRRPSCSSRRSSNSSRRSSTASHSNSRRSSNCSRRSSHLDSDEEQFLHHHHHHRGSRASVDHNNYQHRGSEARRSSRLPSPTRQKELEERAELEMGGIPVRHRKIIIMIIGSVSIFILAMSVVLIAVSLTLSPTIDDLVRKGNEDIYRSMSAGASTSSPTTDGAANITSNSTVPSTGPPG